ncbi:DUF5302 domain-containing protein [Amycolatopsis nigrescens]|uniref:DUF5302 domain-containing protein n=1 Tax=Amycolatopsis nigrescens TaxID=381445 RepID=UPI000368F495|nr:DUF5302 domain-containing protein [Amycolatopsis nigrescens]
MSEQTPSQQDGAPEDAQEDGVKRKFREALERKQAQTKARQSHEDRGSKVGNTAHGPAAGKREFRRKSG